MGWISADRYERLSIDERHELLQLRLRRRGLLRAVAASAAGLGAGPLLVTRAAAATPSAAVPLVGRWLAYGADPSRQMRLTWQTAAQVSGSVVRFGTDTSYGSVVPGEAAPLRTTLGTGETLDQYYVRARLDGLEPGRTYHYRVEHDGVVGRDTTFTLAPAVPTLADRPAPFSFTAVGDEGTTTASAALDRLVAAQAPAFHLVAGDLAYADTSGVGMAADHFHPRRWNDYLGQISPASKAVPWMVAMGNHEMEAVYGQHGTGGVTHRFQLPGNGPTACPATYTFRYANVGVLCLDANDVSNELPANRGYSGGTQTAWVDATLAGLRADPTVDFIVVVFHQCAYATSSSHGSDGGVRSAWTPLFDRHRVDLVVNGHNHCYERSDPIRAGVAARAAPTGATVEPETDGTTYVVAGGGGRDLNGFPGARPTGTGSDVDIRTRLWEPGRVQRKETVGWSRVRHSGYGLLRIDVVPGPVGGRSTMTVRSISTAGHDIDNVVLSRLHGHAGDRAAEAAWVAGGVGAVAVAAGAAAVLARRRPGPRADDGAG